MAVMYCWRSGKIEIGRRGQKGALPIASGPTRILKSSLPMARLSYDSKTYLVPGIPEAPDELAAYKAFADFRDRVRARISRVPA